ncbi:acyl-CoA dehydratase activase [Geomonas anaerohicana]|uniref:2-hydroxyglutaryl-CoA dehydratase n=1 Tax=Geomonas anaerohicana TaxID=2798583 RepID=A0ABS0YDK9_9BACT|nr:acyl-CoA dehydratase activase [Geomonas anaerohicana]MBJ6750351.1 2-hydroxyglutaryl-CoA dehydratase [Geomonas anaerohicana]
MVAAGIDIGSTGTKAVIFDGEIRASVVVPTGWDPKAAGLEAYRQALECAGIEADEVQSIVGTGYGRVSLPIFDRKVTEITCHARGAHFLYPETRSVIDIGGQDSKVISVDAQGRVAEFAMNDKCAAGTGRFLQVMAGVLDVSLEQLGQLAVGATPVPISSMCAVFAESEVIGLLARGTDKGSIAAGIFHSIAGRIQGLAGKVSLSHRVTFSGGVALNRELCRAIGTSLGVDMCVPQAPQMVGALGAAILGYEA